VAAAGGWAGDGGAGALVSKEVRQEEAAAGSRGGGWRLKKIEGGRRVCGGPRKMCGALFPVNQGGV
jgi:hypothetical protein